MSNNLGDLQDDYSFLLFLLNTKTAQIYRQIDQKREMNERLVMVADGKLKDITLLHHAWLSYNLIFVDLGEFREGDRVTYLARFDRADWSSTNRLRSLFEKIKTELGIND